jgi:hypothetical protein
MRPSRDRIGLARTRSQEFGLAKMRYGLAVEKCQIHIGKALLPVLRATVRVLEGIQ